MEEPPRRPPARLRVLVLHPRLEPVGGAEVVAAWAIQALARDHRVDVLTWSEPDFAALDRDYGTSLVGADIGVRRPPGWLRRAFEGVQRLDRDPWSVQRFALLMRMTRRIRDRYDVVLSTYGEADLGGPGIQYVHQPWCGEPFQAIASADRSLAHRLRAVLGVRLRPWRLVSGFSFDRMRSNLTLANSEATAAALGRLYGIGSEILHPPVPPAPPGLPWAERENGFACIGRLVAAKRIDRILAVLERVRASGELVTLHVVGSPQAEEPEYGRDILRRASEAGAWVTVHAGLSRAELSGLLGRMRYGIHAMEDEPFGIAVAEMVQSGCLVFVPEAGGPREIVGEEPRLAFRNEDEAVERIVGMLRSTASRAEALAHLAERRRGFSAERFAEGLRAVVERSRRVGQT